MFLFVVLVGIICFVILLVQTNNESKQTTKTIERQFIFSNAFDIQNLPDTLTVEKREFLQNVATFHGVRYVTNDNIKTYNLHIINELFQAMPGWDIWDESIHNATGQYDRIGRADSQENISVLFYNPEFFIAKVMGNSGSAYITSGKQCSCMDFRKRHLPCKHMYKLAMELDGDFEKSIGVENEQPLRHLHIALAGRFSGKIDDIDNIRAKINRLGGIWSEAINADTDILITGKSPSEAKIQKAKECGIAIIKESDIDKLFFSCIKQEKEGLT